MAGKQAKIVSDNQAKLMLAACLTHRYPLRDQVLVLLSFKAGLRASEIAKIRWRMVLDSEGLVDDVIHIENSIAKKKGGRIIPMHPELKSALVALKSWTEGRRRTIGPNDPIVISERAMKDDSRAWTPMHPTSIVNWFSRMYDKLGVDGCSSHSGRRTFITKSARKASQAGASLRDIQQMAGHKHLTTTQGYIEGDTEAKRKLIDLI